MRRRHQVAVTLGLKRFAYRGAAAPDPARFRWVADRHNRISPETSPIDSESTPKSGLGYLRCPVAIPSRLRPSHCTSNRQSVPRLESEVNDIDNFARPAVLQRTALEHFGRDHRHAQTRIGPRRTVDFRDRRRRSRVRRPRLGRGALWLVAGRNTNMAGPPWAYPRVVYGHQSTSLAVDRRRRATTGQLLRSCSQRSTLDCSALFYRCLA